MLKIKSNIILKVLFAITVSCMVLCFTACNGSVAENNEDLQAQNICIVYGCRNNSAATPDESKIKPYLMAALKGGGSMTYVRADGEPKQVNFPDPDRLKPSKKANDQNAEKENNNKVRDFYNFIIGDDSRATTDEIDIVSAIAVASKTFPNNGLDNNILVIDSGIVTKGRISMLNSSFLNSDISEIDSMKNLPKLDSITNIYWMGFNAVAGEQKAIPSDYNLDESIKTKYNAFMKACGVKNDISWIPNSSGKMVSDSTELPKVSIVDFSSVNNISDNWKQIKLDDCILKFKPDSAEFADYSTAITVLQQIADKLKSSPSINIDINGYVAISGTEVGNLSQLRAQSVMEKLSELGVTNPMKAHGKGAGPYKYLDDFGNISAANRFVELVKS